MLLPLDVGFYITKSLVFKDYFLLAAPSST